MPPAVQQELSLETTSVSLVISRCARPVLTYPLSVFLAQHLRYYQEPRVFLHAQPALKSMDLYVALPLVLPVRTQVHALPASQAFTSTELTVSHVMATAQHA